MRWLIGHPGPNFSVADVHRGWTEALTALGEDVIVFNLDDRLKFFDAALAETGHFNDLGNPLIRKMLTREQAITQAALGILDACYACWPDVVLLISAFFTPPDMLRLIRTRGHKIVLLHTESPYQDTEQLIRAAHASLNLVNDPANISQYRDLGIPAEYMPHSYRPALHHPGPARPELQCDLAFVGTGFTSRVAFLEQMDLTGLDVLLAGYWKELAADSPLRGYVGHDMDECLDNDSAAEIYRAARAGLNIYRREAEDAHVGQGWALSPREVEMAACGLFYLRDPRGEGDEVLPMLPSFASPGDASEKLRWWLAHDGYRMEAARKARAAIEGRTFVNAARELLRLLDRQPVRM